LLHVKSSPNHPVPFKKTGLALAFFISSSNKNQKTGLALAFFISSSNKNHSKAFSVLSKKNNWIPVPFILSNQVAKGLKFCSYFISLVGPHPLNPVIDQNSNLQYVQW